MDREIISSKQGITLLIMFMFGSTFVISTGIDAKRDLWLANLMAIAFAIPMLSIYAKLLSSFPGKDLYDILQLVFGRFIGDLIMLLYIWYALHLGGLVLCNFNEFINTVGLSETPKVVPGSIIIILCTWMVKQGIEGLGRWGEIMLPVLLLIALTAIILSIPNIEIENLLPIMENGVKPVIQGAFLVYTFPLTETVLFTAVFSSLKDSKSALKVYLIALIIAGLTLMLSGLRNVLVLGQYIISLNYYPTYNAVSRINIGNFLQRLESAVSITFLLGGFVKICICLLSASKGISKLFRIKDYRFIVLPVALIVLNFSFIVTEDSMELRRWNRQIYPIYASLFEIVLPIIIFIFVKIKSKSLNIK